MLFRSAGQSRANLTKALLDRSNTISANTAKYLEALRQDEYNRAVAQVTAEQNATRLGIQQQYNEGRLGISAQNAATSAARAAAYIQSLQDKGIVTTFKDIKKAKSQLLADPSKYTLRPSGSGADYTIQYRDVDGSGEVVTKTYHGANAEEAISQLPTSVKNAGRAVGVAGGGYTITDRVVTSEKRPVSRPLAVRTMVTILVNSGMSRAAAAKWVRQNAAALGLNALS